MTDAPERTPLLTAMHNDSLNWPSFVADFLAVYAPRIGQLERDHAELEQAVRTKDEANRLLAEELIQRNRQLARLRARQGENDE